ncbi:MAG: hypothetical protein QXF52_00780 [Thermoproteota archaeon]
MVNYFEEEGLTQQESKNVFKCSNCGAPLNYTPETIACVCEYCGTVNWFSTGRLEIFVLPTRSKDEVVNAFWSRMRSDPDMSRVYGDIELVEVQGFYVPILVGDVSAVGEWSGFKRVTERRSMAYAPTAGPGRRYAGPRAGETYVTRTVTKNGSFNTSMRLAFQARREAAEYGLEELVDQAKSAKDPQPLAALDWKRVGLQVLNAELLPEEAEDELKDMVEDGLRDSIRSSNGLDGFYYYSCQTRVDSLWILLAPIWILVYKYKGGMYRASVSGYNLQFLRVSEPVFLGQRMLYMIGSMMTVVLGAFALTLLTSLENWFPVMVFILVSGAGALLASRAVSDVREERWK